MKALLIVLLMSSLALAGCGGKDGKATPPGGGDTPLKNGKGAIAGLVIDDVYRPVPQALVLLSNGLTATSDASGQFSFVDLEPGSYILRVQADGHEAAPQTAEVVEGEYAEANLMARRIFNEGGRIVTTEYSVFIPCAFATPATLVTFNCVLDLSGDTFRSSTPAINYTGYANATYLVGEVKINQPGNFVFVIRPQGSDANGTEWADVAIPEGDYGRIQIQRDVPHPTGTHTWWNTNPELEAALFFNGQLPNPIDPSDYGVGGTIGVRAQIILSLFLGAPEVNIDNYAVLAD